LIYIYIIERTLRHKKTKFEIYKKNCYRKFFKFAKFSRFFVIRRQFNKRVIKTNIKIELKNRIKTKLYNT